MIRLPRVPILGVGVNTLDLDVTLEFVEERVVSQEKSYICLAPAHAIMACVNDPCLLPVYNEADLVTPDGMAVVWLLHLKGYRQTRRVYGPDLLHAACKYGLSRKWRHYFYGGAPGVADQLAATLQEKYPGLLVAGTCSPPFGRPDLTKDEALVQTINDSHPDLVWVGMSSPWQETWMHEHRDQVESPLMVGVGAAFDFISGNKPQAPIWARRSGLEWLYRLVHEPRRLWPRYREYPRFIALVLREIITKQDQSEK
jgi:N-acetylglucosaminyldiphosphoundecaprenol N-acetyl-beta-D-mannosaminyltransferase